MDGSERMRRSMSRRVKRVVGDREGSAEDWREEQEAKERRPEGL